MSWPYAGVDGILPHRARQLSDAASSMCSCLKATLQSHKPPTDSEPSPKRTKLSALAEQPHGNTVQQVPPQQQLQQREEPIQQVQQQSQQQKQQHQLPDVSACSTEPLGQANPVITLPSQDLQKPDEAQLASSLLPPDDQEADQAIDQDTRQEADGVWQILVTIAVADAPDLCQQLDQQCRDEDMPVTSDLKLADKHDLDKLAAMTDFQMSNSSPEGILLPCRSCFA